MKFNLFGDAIKRVQTKKVPKKKAVVGTGTKKNPVSIPPGRVSDPTDYNKTFAQIINGGKGPEIVSPGEMLDFIPLIRTLYKTNGNLGSVLFDLVQLTNTGHNVKFDQTVPSAKVKKMNDHLDERCKTWGYGTSGIDGLVNKFIAQIWVSGALSIEMVADKRLTKLESVPLINPETIRFGIKKDGSYPPYQKVKDKLDIKNQYIKLNDNTFIYCGLYGDEDTPYGVPPFLTALEAIFTQKDMTSNIKNILKQVGLLGYLEAKLDKPMQNANESEEQYKARLDSLLLTAKSNLLAGFMDGVVVGYEEDHQFEFNSTTKNLGGVNDIFNMNENQMANGLKTPAAFLGLDQGGGEGQLGIVFTKMLSQLKNVQDILKFGLEQMYSLELTLAGFDFKKLTVEFNASTISDELKLWQGKEIKQRVLHNLWVDGIIDQDPYAYQMGFEKAARDVKPPEPGAAPQGDQGGKEKREKDKDKSDRKGRDKDKPQPKRKDKDTRER